MSVLGQAVGLGPSGAGNQPSLFDFSFVETDGGKDYFGDEDLTDMHSEKRGIGLVFQTMLLSAHDHEQNIFVSLVNMKVLSGGMALAQKSRNATSAT